jgi:hypothetical protein
VQADGVLWLAHSFATLEALKDELLIGSQLQMFHIYQEKVPRFGKS